jgi:hypothetical protein
MKAFTNNGPKRGTPIPVTIRNASPSAYSGSDCMSGMTQNATTATTFAIAPANRKPVPFALMIDNQMLIKSPINRDAKQPTAAESNPITHNHTAAASPCKRPRSPRQIRITTILYPSALKKMPSPNRQLLSLAIAPWFGCSGAGGKLIGTVTRFPCRVCSFSQMQAGTQSGIMPPQSAIVSTSRPNRRVQL